jgi:D-beta-D-heptose 7-phosphate kinase/D-beta-D-heptose 1-phosphate adenosyltransferase
MIKNKIVSLPALLKKLKKQSRSKVVFTNGCFDILHAGHVTYLEKARKQGDLLIVALNTDESTRKLKGPTRPINPLPDRMKVIAALESVSYVTSFNEETPLRLIQKILPDVLVKGGDYEVKKIVGYREVTENGGKVKTIPFLEGRSSSNVINKIAQK